MQFAIVLFVIVLLLGAPSTANAAAEAEIADLERRLQGLVVHLVQGEQEEAQRAIATDPGFKILRDSGDIQSFQRFADKRLPTVMANNYARQDVVEVVLLPSRIHAQSYGSVLLLAKLYPIPALFDFTVYKPRSTWSVLNMRYVSGAEEIANVVARVTPERASTASEAKRHVPATDRSPAMVRNLDKPAQHQRPVTAQANLSAGAVRADQNLDETYATTVSEGVRAYRNRDYENAYKIWRKLAEQNHRKAQFHLGSIYLEGRLGPSDRVQAYVWLSRASGAGYEKALTLLTTLVPEMSGDELRSARQILRKGSAKTAFTPKKPSMG